jgi:hypothetical protein
MNVESQALVEPSKILLTSMHLKLGLIKNCVKALNQEEDAFTNLRENFPRLSESKLEEGIFIGSQIETSSRTNTSTSSFKANKRRFETV